MKLSSSTILDVRHEQGARPVPAPDVHRQTKVDVFVSNLVGDSLNAGISDIHGRSLFKRFDGGPTDDVGE